MRVLHVDAGREWRGGQNQVRLLTRELSRDLTLDIRLVTKRDGVLAARAAAAGVRVHGVRWGMGLDPRAWWKLRAEIRRFHPDIVHAHDSHSLALVRAPVVIGHRRVDFHVRPRSAWFRTTAVIAVSAAVKRVLTADGVPPDRITVIPDGIDPDEVRAAAGHPLGIRARLGLPPSTPLAANVAALVDHKDHVTLVRAAAHARAARPDLHWVIAGEGDLRHAVEREIAAHGLGDCVHLVGYIPEADALIREADVFVMSSKEEGMGSVILHALALEKPVVATAAGGIPEVLPAECLVPVRDAASLGERVVAVLTRPPSPVPLPPKFTSKSMVEATLALYRSLV
ncbi:MAG TPA: glycosyltransferase [Gemmatimonadales bacterium]|nr:glycosyltransferase [Gemmatimonadales bacterium]